MVQLAGQTECVDHRRGHEDGHPGDLVARERHHSDRVRPQFRTPPPRAVWRAGAWTHLELRVEGTSALLFVSGASQPALIVHDLKLGEPSGPIAL